MSWSNLTVPEPVGSFETPPAGSHGAVLVAIVDLGTHDDDYKGVTREAHKALFVWELTSCPIEGTTNNHVVGKELTLSLGEKATLRQLLKTWRGRDLGPGENYDLLKLLGQACLVNVTHSSSGDRVFAQFAGLSAVPKGMAVAKAKRLPPLARSLDDEAPVPDWVPWVYGESAASKIARCKEKGGAGKKAAGGNGAGGNGPTQPAAHPDAKMLHEEALPF